MKKDRSTLHLVIALFIYMTVYSCLPIQYGLTVAGASVIAIFIASIYMWLTIGTVWPSMLSLAAVVMTGIAPAKTIWQISWGSYIIVFLMAMMMINSALNKSGLTHRIALWFITRRVVKNRPYVFIGLFLFASLLITYIMDMVPVLMVFMSLGEQICSELGYNKEDKFSKCLFLGIMSLIVAGYGATPIGHAVPLAVFLVIESALNTSISYVKYMLVGIPFSLFFYTSLMLVIRFVVRPDVSKFKNYDLEAKRKEMKPLSKSGKIVTVIFSLMVVMWLFPEFGRELFPAAAEYVSGLSIVVPVLLAVAALCIIKVDRTPLLNVNEALSNVSWGMLIFMATINSISGCISMEASGITVFLKNILGPVAEMLPVSLIIAVGFFLAMVLTQLMTNALTGIIIFTAFSPILLALPETAPMALPFGCVLVMCVSIAFMTPAANPCAPMVFGKGYVDIKDCVKYGTVIVLLTFLAAILFIWPWAQVVF